MTSTVQSVLYTSFVAGRRAAESGRAVELVDPATGHIWNRAMIDDGIVDAAVESAAAAFAGTAWQSFSNQDRAQRLRRLGDLIASHAEELGGLETLANGKPLAHTTAEMRAATKWYHFFASAAELGEGSIREIGRNAEAHVVREPLGVVVAITPFNGALSLGSWKIAPALAAGNTVILKPPPEAPASSIRLAELALEAGFPEGAVNVVIGDAATGRALARHDGVAMVSFTGSTAAARSLASDVAGGLKRFVCEAGGKSAHIVFADADLDDAVIAARQGVFSASGQTCVAGSRIFVEESVKEGFLDRYVASVRRLRVGDPRSAGTHIGPLASQRQLSRVKGFVDRAVAEGARVLVGGESPTMPPPLDGGFWFLPTVLDEVRSEMEICREEVFGPVVSVQSFKTEGEALRLANGVAYGLAAGFWTRDIARAKRLARGLQAGTVWVNCYRLIHWLAPFGGYKQSGLGRENGIEAMDEFTQIKSIVIDHARPNDPFAA